jgi:hypothetical protein
MQKKIFICGATGFLGEHLSEYLLKKYSLTLHGYKIKTKINSDFTKNKEVFKILIPGVMSELIARIRYLNDINRYSSPYDSPSFSILPLPTNTCKTNGNFRQPTDLFGF